MRLTDLDAHFVAASDRGSRFLDGDTIAGAQGVAFQCPKCAEGKEAGEEDGRRFVRGAHYIRVFFSNPVGAPVAPPEVDDNPRWQASGTSLSDLTLNPSINLDVPGNGEGGCRWHGWVISGDAK